MNAQGQCHYEDLETFVWYFETLSFVFNFWSWKILKVFLNLCGNQRFFEYFRNFLSLRQEVDCDAFIKCFDAELQNRNFEFLLFSNSCCDSEFNTRVLASQCSNPSKKIFKVRPKLLRKNSSKNHEKIKSS